LKKEIPEVQINEDIRKYIVDFLKIYVKYLLIYDGKYHTYESEGIIRRLNQIGTLIKAKTHLY